MDTSRIAPFPVLADLPPTERDELAAAMSELEVEAGAEVVTLDDYGTSIYFIEDGEAEVSLTVASRLRHLAPAIHSARSRSS